MASHPNYQEIFKEKFSLTPMELHANWHSAFITRYQLPNPYMSGMFCKLEYKMESLSKLAPRFRLGSLNYTEWMEGKKEVYTRYMK